MNLEKQSNESNFEYKLRLCKAKVNKDIDLDWAEIVELLGLDISADHLRKTAYGLLEYDEYIHGFQSVGTTILSVSDFHVPFQLPIEMLSEYRNRVDVLQLNGDIVDMQALSKFPKAYRVSPMEELIIGRKYIIDLIEYINPKKVIVTYGNHDNRFQQYLARNLDSDILELMPDNSLELIFEDGFTHFNKRERTKVKYEPIKDVFPEIEIEYVGNWYCQIGDTIFCHPIAYSSGILKTAEKAMLWFRNEGYVFTHLVMAHTHRSGQYTIGNTTIYEQGCFCDVKKNNYSDGKLVNSQKEGFIFICQDNEGNTIDSKTKLVVLN